ncbi:MAG: methyltransferase domain-containing protein [Lachnospiraceae bacterium]|nr:methyltransferase domain-containing protein [Lachnospiraceae bacterium]
MNGVNEKKVCFVICSSDRLYTEECLHYIYHLNVPEGYQIEVLTVEEAKSMAAGYNEGMQASDAKYKVYLHQDTFIINRDFIRDFLDVFKSDEKIGMIGMIGAPKLPDSGVMWEGKRCGAVYLPGYLRDNLFRPGGTGLTEVEAIDGLLMITQYDIPWREDIFDKWDFYDCSQSQEFIRRGYKVVVPALGEPWCMHDSALSAMNAYDGERKKFLQEYFQEDEAELEGDNVTVVLTVHRRLDQLRDTLEWLDGVDGIANIIIAVNESEEDTAQWLSAGQYEYLWFDEGVQGYGKLWNTVLSNFETEDCIVFLEAGVYPEKGSLRALARALESERAAMASPSTNNFFPNERSAVKSKEELLLIGRRGNRQRSGKTYDKILCSNWKMWAVRRDIFEQNGLFREELSHPEEVLTDYSLRMIQGGLAQIVCLYAYAYESFHQCSEIYSVAEEWRFNARVFMKKEWGMNYFNLKPNRSLAVRIQEGNEEEFKVLEVGCDLGATLVEIQNRFPKCKTYGLDINEAAVEIAKHVTEAKYGNIDELRIPFREKFDYIIFGDVLEHLRHPEEVVDMCRDSLNEDGCIIACIPNVMHISVMEQLLEGRFVYQDVGLLDRTHIHFFTYYEIMNLFRNAGYEVKDIDRRIFAISDREQAIVETLLGLSDQTEEWMYTTFQYVVRAQKRPR